VYLIKSSFVVLITLRRLATPRRPRRRIANVSRLRHKQKVVYLAYILATTNAVSVRQLRVLILSTIILQI
jgi:hypothetical protein